MAKIILGIGSSHGPMLSTPPAQWGERVPADRKNAQHHYRGKVWTFDELVAARRDENLEKQIRFDVWQQRHAACRAALGRLANVFHQAKVDIAIIIGNDQREIFNAELTPALAVFWGDSIVNSMYSEERIAALPPGIGIAVPGHIPPDGATYPGAPDLGRHLLTSLTSRGFDVSSLTQMPRDETPHAFGFVYRQIMLDKPVPSVPVILNTFYPPNQPTIRRCYEFGRTLVEAIESWPTDARVALIASGGLTHFVVDEVVDRAVFDCLRDGTLGPVEDMGEAYFQAGTSEVKNWIPVAGAMAHLDFKFNEVDYVPCYRSEAGTGNGMGFAYWQP
jgi:3-O-methylgallate 3,4-dioxygenase